MQKDIHNGQLNTALTLGYGYPPNVGYGIHLAPASQLNPYQHHQTRAANDPSYSNTGVTSTDAYPDNNPKTAIGSKKLPLEVVPPSALHALAEAFADGAKKYGPYNWREKTISSSVYYGAALRHLTAWWDGEDVAEDSGLAHLHHALACIAMLIDGKSVGKLNDNRPPKGAASKMQKKWLDRAANDEKYEDPRENPLWRG